MKTFDLGDILSVVTGKLLSPRGMDGIYDVLNYLTTDNLYTHQIVRAMDECRPHILTQHPALREIDACAVSAKTWRTWLTKQKTRFGDTLPLAPIPPDDHARPDPVEELKAMVPHAKIIVVKPNAD